MVVKFTEITLFPVQAKASQNSIFQARNATAEKLQKHSELCIFMQFSMQDIFPLLCEANSKFQFGNAVMYKCCHHKTEIAFVTVA